VESNCEFFLKKNFRAVVMSVVAAGHMVEMDVKPVQQTSSADFRSSSKGEFKVVCGMNISLK
jgi:hypothetical protein